MISPLVTLPVKLTVRQHAHLKTIKEIHGRSMASQIRTLIQHQMYGIGGQSVSRANLNEELGPKRVRPVQVGPSGYAACVRDLKKIFEARGKSK